MMRPYGLPGCADAQITRSGVSIAPGPRTWGSPTARSRRGRVQGYAELASVGRSTTAASKNRVAARTDEQPDNDQDDAEDDRALDEHHDPGDNEHDCDEPQEEIHAVPATHTRPMSCSECRRIILATGLPTRLGRPERKSRIARRKLS
jgi:hypothetical protein